MYVTFNLKTWSEILRLKKGAKKQCHTNMSAEKTPKLAFTLPVAFSQQTGI